VSIFLFYFWSLIIVRYGYSGPNGPDKWGSLSPIFQTCESGKSQSPIDINDNDVVKNNNLEKLEGEYKPVEATLVNTGYNIIVHFDDPEAGELTIDGKTYKLKQMHWHTPSEHTMNGTQYPMELQVVHKADDGSFTIIAVLYEYGEKEDPILKKIKDELVELGEDKCSMKEESEVEIKKIEFKMLKEKAPKYYRYEGSLTFPPCTEKVIWNIIAKVKTVTKEQVKAVTNPLEYDFKVNARPVQPLNGRKVEISKSHYD
ncbi:Alpha carbonic anhydrase 1, chloroplastic, partial [Linum perenne]